MEAEQKYDIKRIQGSWKSVDTKIFGPLLVRYISAKKGQKTQNTLVG
jgi:hypothetical protein